MIDTNAAGVPSIRTRSGLVPLESVLCTEELTRRLARAPDHAKENRALLALARALADSPQTILQTLAETILEVLGADSSGISLLSEDEQSFFWPAVAGAWQPQLGGGTPRYFGPCGDVLDCKAPLLFKRLDRRYDYFASTPPAPHEALLVPFYNEGKAAGTIWAVAHDEGRQFDAEDLRLLESLGVFASAAYQSHVSAATLRRSEGELRDFVENAAVGLHWVGPDGTILWANQTELDLLGCTREEYVGRNITDFHADPPVIADILARLTGGETLHEHAARLRCKDGSIRHVLISSNGYFEGDKFIHTRCFTRDITERKLADAALREIESFNRSIIDSSPDCIKVLDLDGNLLSMHNGQALLGIEDIGPFLNKSWIEFWKGDDRQAARAAVEAATARGEGSFVGFFRTLRGEPKWWDVKISPILDTNGKPERLLAVSRDVTERRQKELNLEFLASVSQDLMQWSNVDEMMQTVGAKTAAYLHLSICAFVEIDEAAEQVVINHDWHRDDVPSLVGVHRLADFVEGEFIRTARAGETIVVRDVATDPRTDVEKFAALKIASFVCVPLIRDGQWRFSLCLYRSEAYDWGEDEIELARELTARVWARLERLRTEEALRQSEERYRSLFNLMDEGYCVIEMIFDEHDKAVDFLYLEVNPSFEKQSGMHDAVGKRVSFFAPNLEAHWLEIYGKVALTGEPIRYTNEAVDIDGRWFDLYAFRVGGADSRQVAVLFRNVTQGRNAQKALLDSEERYRGLFESMDEASCIIEMIFDEQGQPVDYRFLVVNPTFARQTGMNEAAGKRMRELIPSLEAHWFEIYGKVAQTGEPIRFVNQAKDMDNRWFDVYAYRVGGAGSQKVAIIFNDISERRRSEEALRASEERYRYLFNSIDEGFCVVEMIFDADEKAVDYRFLEVNPSFEVQTGMRDASGKRIREFAPHLEAAWFEAYGAVALTGEPVRFVNESKDLERWFDVYAFRIGGPESRKVAIIFNNVTARTKAERALRESAGAMVELDHRKDEFLAMLGHELRNPLAPISNAVHLLRLQKNEDPVQRQARGVIERQVGQLTHLIDDLLEVSRINTGRVRLRQERIVIGGIVERAVETAQPLIAQHRHELTVTLPADPVWLHADAARLEQVVVNLLTNAAKYTDDGGRIWLSVVQESDSTVLRVRDTGIGISPELLPRIFDLFTQAERSVDRSQGGLGIGLCLVQRLVELHGGTVEARSVVGQGSEFVVCLPLLLPSMAPSPSPFIEPTRPNQPGCTVLIVDDNVDSAQTLAMLLEVSGHVVRVAYDGPAGLEAALAQRPDVVLLDIGLPGLTGFEVARRIRREPMLETAVLIAVTGYGQHEDRQRSREAGFDHHLAKPADFAELERILATVAEKAALRLV